MSKGHVSKSMVKTALRMKGKGQAKQIFIASKHAFDMKDYATGRAIWGIGKKRIKFLKKNHR